MECNADRRKIMLIWSEVKVVASVRVTIRKSVILQKVHDILESPIAESARHNAYLVRALNERMFAL